MIMSKIMFSLNPISPINWLVFIILFFTLKPKLEKNDKTKNKLIKWPLFIGVYMLIMIPVYFVFCMIAGVIPPLKMIAAICEN